MRTADPPFPSLTPTRKQLGQGSSYRRDDRLKGDQTPGLVPRGFSIHIHTETHTPGTCTEIPTRTHPCVYTHTHTHTHTHTRTHSDKEKEATFDDS